MTMSKFEANLRATEPLAAEILDLIAGAGDVNQRLWLLWRCAAALAAELDENEIQAHLCDAYLYIEVAGERATMRDETWVQPTLHRSEFT